MMDTIGGRGRVEFVNGNREGGFEDSQLSELLFEFSLPPPYSRKQCDNFNFNYINKIELDINFDTITKL